MSRSEEDSILQEYEHAMGFLTTQQMDLLHAASLELLETVGVKVDHPVVFQKLLRGRGRGGSRRPHGALPTGARSAEHRHRAAHHPASPTAGAACRHVGADGGTMFWGGNTLYLAQGRKCVEITTRELATLSRLMDRLPHIHGIVGTSIADYPPVGPRHRRLPRHGGELAQAPPPLHLHR